MTEHVGSKAFSETNALDVKKSVKENNFFWGSGGRNNRHGRYNPNNKKSFQWNHSQQSLKKEHQESTSLKRETVLFQIWYQWNIGLGYVVHPHNFIRRTKNQPKTKEKEK